VVPGVTNTTLVSGVGESFATNYTYTTNDNQATKPQPKLTGAERRAARSTKQAAQRKATLETQGKEKGLDIAGLFHGNRFLDRISFGFEHHHWRSVQRHILAAHPVQFDDTLLVYPLLMFNHSYDR
jgi:hypothetical protein